MVFIAGTRFVFKPINNGRKQVFYLILLIFVITITFIHWSNWTQTSKTKQEKMKYILIWTPKDYAPLPHFYMEQKAFSSYHCPLKNCYVTDDRKHFGGKLEEFDAILFNGRNINRLNRTTLPLKRFSFQKYVFINMESADNYPICNNIFDNGFFNWTVSYKLNSDIIYPYMLIKDSDGKVIGPKRDMNWIKNMKVVDDKLSKSLRTKKKAVAWFVSNCYSRSHRFEYVKKLQKELSKFNIKIDIYGNCGNLTCPRDKHEECIAMLKKDYHFYLAMENTFAEDYVTEKVLHALQNNVIPIVYGGADYSRFLPPGSYLDSRAQSLDKLAITIDNLIRSPKLYLQYFKWKSHYTYSERGYVQGVCKLCEMLNNKASFDKQTSYYNFMSWWHPTYKERCW